MGLLEVISTPERREEARRQQEMLRERYGSRLAQHPAQSNYVYGLARMQSAFDQLGVEELESQQEVHLLNQLAEGLALQGRFDEAASIVASEAHKAEYEAKASAMAQLGSGCDCPLTVTKPSPRDAKGETSSTRQLVEEVFDGSAVVKFSKCLLCGTYAAQIG